MIPAISRSAFPLSSTRNFDSKPASLSESGRGVPGRGESCASERFSSSRGCASTPSTSIAVIFSSILYALLEPPSFFSRADSSSSCADLSSFRASSSSSSAFAFPPSSRRSSFIMAWVAGSRPSGSFLKSRWSWTRSNSTQKALSSFVASTSSSSALARCALAFSTRLCASA